MNITDEGTRLLSIAIIQQAVKDYKANLKSKVSVLELERFFKSSWFDCLIEEKINGEVIIEEVRKQVEEWQQKRTLKIE